MTLDGADLALSLRRLACRVQWLEDRLRAAGGVPVADLDTVDDAERDLADAVLAGRDAEETLLDAPARHRLLADVEAFARLRHEHEQAADAVVAISTTLESSRRGDPVHLNELRRYSGAEARLAAATRSLNSHAPTAHSSARRLNEDEQLGTELKPTVEAGRQAESTLTETLRHRLHEEIVKGALLPTWLSSDLGPGPTSPATEERWLELAATAWVHRLVYEVDDATSALGPEPATGTPRHEAESYARLAAELRHSDA